MSDRCPLGYLFFIPLLCEKSDIGFPISIFSCQSAWTNVMSTCQGLTFVFYTPRKLCLWEGILFSRCPNERTNERTTDRPTERVSVTFCFLNNFKNHRWNFIKFCKHFHMYKANTTNEKLRARGQYYGSYFPL